VAWRTESVAPGVACHFGSNFLLGLVVLLLPSRAVMSYETLMSLPWALAALLAGTALAAWCARGMAGARPAPAGAYAAPAVAAPRTLAAGETAR
jgi:hypothetical protein